MRPCTLMLVPRRVRRRLLLPPGWVALGFLLLLGCQALLRRGHELQAKNIMQLLVPPLNPREEVKQFWGPVYSSIEEIENFRPWKNIDFRGLNNAYDLQMSEALLRAMKADTAYSRGVRIHFTPQMKYVNFMDVLDVLYQLNLRYWVDSQQTGITIYALTTHLTLKERADLAADCRGGSGGDLIEVIPLTTAQIIAALQQPDWQPLSAITGSMIILLITAGFGIVLIAFGSKYRHVSS